MALVTPNASPVSRASPDSSSAVATAPTALTAPPSSASTSAPPSAVQKPPPAIIANSVIGRIAPETATAISTGRRPIRSESMPTSGVTAITASAANVESHSDSPSLISPTEVRNVGT